MEGIWKVAKECVTIIKTIGIEEVGKQKMAGLKLRDLWREHPKLFF